MVEIPEGTSGSCKLAGDKGSIAPAMMQSFYWTLRERKSSKPSFREGFKNPSYGICPLGGYPPLLTDGKT